MLKRYKKVFVGLALATIILLFFATAFHGFYGAAGLDEQFYSIYGHMLETQGFAHLMYQGIDGVKYLTYGGVALFFWLLGPSNASYIMYASIMYAFTILVIFFLGKKLSGYTAGLASALLYALFPLGIEEVSRGGDDVIMAFFAALSMLLLIYALYAKSNRNAYLLSLSAGFVAILGILSVSEEVLSFLPLLLILGYLVVRHRGNLHYAKLLMMSLLGVGFAILVIMAFSFFAFGTPQYVPTALINNYNSTTQHALLGNVKVSPFYGLENYIEYMFLTNKANKGLFNLSMAETGFYYYLLVAAGAIAIIYKDRKASLPAVWVLSIFLYLCFGTMSLTSYLQIDMGIPVTRYLLILAPSATLLIGMAMADFLEGHPFEKQNKVKNAKEKVKGKKGKSYYIKVAAVAILLGAIVANDLVQVNSIKISMYSYEYPFYNIGKFVNTLPKGSSILTVDYNNAMPLPILSFTDYNYNISWTGINELNCTIIKQNDYLITVTDNTLASKCNLVSIYTQPPYPRYLLNHTLFSLLVPLPNVTTNTTYTVYKT
ncbi:MAG: ArnT family glycosyltransferase [Candidatus Micrarchaeia archaeon]